VPAVTALFAHGGAFTPDAFAAHQVESGVFYGVEDATGALAAVGGTHIVDYTRGLAAIGNMYTRPDCRGRGFASAVLAAIVASSAGGWRRHHRAQRRSAATPAHGASTNVSASLSIVPTSRAWRRRKYSFRLRRN
jgi:GNAT superfamily N-acetyltransferase